MTHRLSSPPLIKGIDGIVSRPPNEVNYSTLNAKRMETRNQPGKEKSRKYKKYERSGNMAKDVKKDEKGGKIGNLMEPGNRNEIKLTKTDVESNGEGGGDTRAPKRRKCGKYGKSKPITDTTSDSVYSCTSGKIKNWMEPGDENEIETMKKDVGLDREEVGETGEPQQQKCEKFEAKATGENSNSSNTTITTLQLLEEQVQKIKALETRTRAATAEALNGQRMKTGKQPENKIRQKYEKYGLKKMDYMKEWNTGKNGN